MPRTRRTLALLALACVLVGALAGAIAALALPRSTPAPGAPRVPVRRVAAALPTAPGQLGLDAVGATPTILTAHDPAGGPDWALRRVAGPFALPHDVPRSHVGRELLGRQDCLELGRVVAGRFGWLDGAGTFRPTAAGSTDPPRLCHPAGAAPVPTHDTMLLTWVTHPDFGAPQAAATLVWGAVPAGTRDVTVTSDGHAARAHRGDGALLAFLPARAAAPHTLRVVAVDAAGHRQDLYAPQDIHVPGVPDVRTARLTARTADPTGGASWGVATARTADGRWCYTNAGRVVDGVVGEIARGLDLFGDQSAFAFSCTPAPAAAPRLRTLTRERPLMYGFTQGDPPDGRAADAAAGRVALRAETTNTVYYGLARPDVRTITVITPSQTRVIRPTGAAHAFVVALAGSFPTGRIQFVSTFADGTTATQSDRPSL